MLGVACAASSVDASLNKSQHSHRERKSTTPMKSQVKALGKISKTPTDQTAEISLSQRSSCQIKYRLIKKSKDLNRMNNPRNRKFPTKMT